MNGGMQLQLVAVLPVAAKVVIEVEVEGAKFGGRIGEACACLDS